MWEIVLTNKFPSKSSSSIYREQFGVIKFIEALEQVFSSEFWEISKDTFFTEHLWTTTTTISGSSRSYLQMFLGIISEKFRLGALFGPHAATGFYKFMSIRPLK